MAYFSSESSELGYFGCGADCSCKSCRTTASNLSEVYEADEPEAPAPAKPPPAPKMAGWFGAYPVGRARPAFVGANFGRPPFAFGRPAWGFGQVPLRTPWRTRVNAGAPPQYLRFLTLDQFNWNDASLTPRHQQMVRFLADHVRASWTSMRPIGFVRLIGHTDDTGPESSTLVWATDVLRP